MSKNIKTDFKIKLKAVLEYREGKKSLLDISKELSVSREQIRRWVHKYESLGEEGLKNKTTHKCYSREVKIKAIREYLSGEYSLIALCIKYEISSVSVLQRWIMLYNNHHNITKSYPDKGYRPRYV